MVSIRSACGIASVVLVATASAFHADSHHRTLQAVNFRQEMLDEINAARKTRKLPPLCLNTALMYAAQNQANDMAENNFISSKGSDKSTPKERAAAVKFKAETVTEIVGAGFPTVSTIVAAWVNASTAKSTLLSDFNVMGPGYAFDKTKKYVHFWAVDFSEGTCGDDTPTDDTPSVDGSGGEDSTADVKPPSSGSKKKEEESDVSDGSGDDTPAVPAAPASGGAGTPAGRPPAPEDETLPGVPAAAPTAPVTSNIRGRPTAPVAPGTVHAASGAAPAPPVPDDVEAPSARPSAAEEQRSRSGPLPIVPANPAGHRTSSAPAPAADAPAGPPAAPAGPPAVPAGPPAVPADPPAVPADPPAVPAAGLPVVAPVDRRL